MDIYIFDAHGNKVQDESKYLHNGFTFQSNYQPIHAPFIVCYINSGGVEGQFKSFFNSSVTNYYYIITNNSNNSLAAGLEINTFIHQSSKKSEILYGSFECILEKLLLLKKINRSFLELSKIRLGVIGKPSEWLIASNLDRKKVTEILGITFVDIDLEEIIDLNQIQTLELLHNFKPCNNEKLEFYRAEGIYKTLKRVVSKYSLDGLTISCFDLIKRLETTCCLALSVFNSEQIVATCEGDETSLLTQMIIKTLTNKSSFQANPASINEGSMILSHCMCPLDMLEDYTYLTHFESKIGVAIKGTLKTKESYIFKVDPSFSNYLYLEGTISENLKQSDLCRTQIKLTGKNFLKVLDSYVANHLMVVYGDDKLLLSEFMKILNLRSLV